MHRGDEEELEEHSDDLEGDGIHVDGDVSHEECRTTLVAVSEGRCNLEDVHGDFVVIETDRLTSRVDEIAADTVGVRGGDVSRGDKESLKERERQREAGEVSGQLRAGHQTW
jgi:hypothetical protein